MLGFSVVICDLFELKKNYLKMSKNKLAEKNQVCASRMVRIKN